MFRINEVLKVNGHLNRILADVSEELLVWITMDHESALPELVTKRELVEAIELETLVRTEDPYENLYYLVLEDDSPAKTKRDENYHLIKSIVCDPNVYLPKVRSSLINQIIAEHGSTKQTIYRLLRRYWQRGQTANALIPDYTNSGARGQKRVAKDKKLGRPRLHKPGVGVGIDGLVEKLFKITIDRYLLTDKKHPLS
ncbi:hypothetical protein JWZ98_22215 [Methylomonas sp. EFPC1]|uniref:hypothetical protein n=1 Tax=Methylomonas sp. EFPC1 TaxID=2812647 RepID=UPI001967D15E|nr:hypothetical protein [Methylomonas sp. EFPC1]QSB01310.1 hypothetical protein JWZ98_22215 [Methylomonas sp. EFPC1]